MYVYTRICSGHDGLPHLYAKHTMKHLLLALTCSLRKPVNTIHICVRVYACSGGSDCGAFEPTALKETNCNNNRHRHLCLYALLSFGSFCACICISSVCLCCQSVSQSGSCQSLAAACLSIEISFGMFGRTVVAVSVVSVVGSPSKTP